MNKVQFFWDSLKHIKTRGTVAPTSKFTCQQIVSHIDFKQTHVIVELGAGEGCITKHLLSHLREDAQLLCFEIDQQLCQQLRQLDDPRLIIIQDSAEHLDRYLKHFGIDQVDYIVSGIPFIVLPNALGAKIIGKAKAALRPGGRFIQFHYSPMPKKRYQEWFDQVNVGFEVRNIPPAFVFVCA
ncbi:MAG: rRNA adenine N-6-methyltransferase family protein [Bacteroidota bacterium]